MTIRSSSASFSIFEQMGSIGKKESLVRTKGTRNEEEIRNNRISTFFFISSSTNYERFQVNFKLR